VTRHPLYIVLIKSLKARHLLAVALCLCIVLLVAIWTASRININPSHSPGEVMDEFEGVAVYYNGAINQVQGRNVAPDGYNIGLRWQCVEFVKRYYLERFGHRMPESRGHAKDFYNAALQDGELNKARNLVQYRNGGATMPAVGDIVVFAPWLLNAYGHVAIVSRVERDSMEVVQQNPGPFGSSRERHTLAHASGLVNVGSGNVLGWLRRP
jgi:surface antigen